jgi:hypothetical protein
MYVSLNVLGSLAIEVNGDRLDARYVDNLGAVRDYFTIRKGGGPGNVPPTVSLTSPADGATFTAPVDITFHADASDSDGNITQVAFYADGGLLGTANTSPYEFTWTGAPVGPHSLTARATDDGGAVSTSATISVTVNAPAGTPTTVSFQNGVNGYTGLEDVSLLSDAPATNVGGAADLLADGSPDCAALMRWDLSAIPVGKTVTAVSLTFTVSNRSTQSYEFYALRRMWVEAEATWNQAAAGMAWQTPGANGVADRESTVLASVLWSSTGTKTVSLTPDGVAKVQEWIDAPASNYGFILMDYAQSDGLDVRSSEYGTVSQRPILTITYQ